ncbi:MAG: ferritin family protein [Candidatus Aenigmatarchaeota archaeon]
MKVVKAKKIGKKKPLAKGAAKASGFDFSDASAVLKAALETEINGRELYLQYGRTVKSRMAKEVFTNLASEELTHIEDIKAFLKSTEMGTWVDVSGMTKEDSVGNAKTLFGRLISEMGGRVGANDDDNKARDVSMQFEKNGYEYYEKAAKAAKNEKLRQFLQWLMEQEQSHYMFIRNAFDYMNHPDSWYASEEGWLLEG